MRPVKSKKVKKKHQKIALCYVVCQGKVMLMKRPGEGLLAGLWGFPLLAYDEGYEDQVLELLDEDFGIKATISHVKSQARHVFTHLIWDMTLLVIESDKIITSDLPQVEWVDENEINQFALPTAFKKLLSC